MAKGEIVKSNFLIEASYKLSVNESRVLLTAISQIETDGTLTQDKGFRIKLSDIQSLSGNDSNDMFKQLHEAVTSLRRREVKFFGFNGELVETSWLQSAEYDPKKKTEIIIRFPYRLAPYLDNFTKDYTKYQLKHVAQINSTYAVRLYELLAKWKRKGVAEIKLDLLRSVLLGDAKYRVFNDFKRYALETAVDQVNEYTNFNVSYELIKSGKTVEAIRFKFKQKIAKKTPSELPPPTLKPVVRQLAEPEPEFEPDPLRIHEICLSEGISHTQARHRLIKEHKERSIA